MFSSCVTAERWIPLPVSQALQNNKVGLGTRLQIYSCERFAYEVCSAEEWTTILTKNGWDMVQLRDARYDHVIHMVSAASGAELSYQTTPFRTEEPHLARERDAAATKVWSVPEHFCAVLYVCMHTSPHRPGLVTMHTSPHRPGLVTMHTSPHRPGLVTMHTSPHRPGLVTMHTSPHRPGLVTMHTSPHRPGLVTMHTSPHIVTMHTSPHRPGLGHHAHISTQAWLGHPCHDVLDNSTGFEDKLHRVIRSISTRIGGNHLCARHQVTFGVHLLKSRAFLLTSMPDDNKVPIGSCNLRV